MSEELGVLKTVTRRLTSAGIPYMVTGSIATNFYAVPRMTRDIDIVVELSKRDVDLVVGIFQEDFYLERETVRSAVEEKGMFNLIHSTFVIKVDFIVRKDTEYRREEFSRRRLVNIEGEEVFIVAPEDLVISKLDWARDTRSELQLADVRNLLACVADLDRAYLTHWTALQGLDSLYREVSG